MLSAFQDDARAKIYNRGDLWGVHENFNTLPLNFYFLFVWSERSIQESFALVTNIENTYFLENLNK